MLLVGLGNPGSEYKLTRHNVGFIFLDFLAKRLQIEFKKSSLINGEVAKKDDLILLKPLTFMNSSGEAVFKALSFFKLEVDDLVVIHDELDLEIGKTKFKKSLSTAGHNGLKSINNFIKEPYKKIRIGIGKPKSKSEIISYVLSNFKESEFECIKKVCLSLQEAIPLLKEEFQKAASLYTKNWCK